MVGNVALGQVCLRLLLFSCQYHSTCTPCSFNHLSLTQCDQQLRASLKKTLRIVIWMTGFNYYVTGYYSVLNIHNILVIILVCVCSIYVFFRIMSDKPVHSLQTCSWIHPFIPLTAGILFTLTSFPLVAVDFLFAHRTTPVFKTCISYCRRNENLREWMIRNCSINCFCCVTRKRFTFTTKSE